MGLLVILPWRLIGSSVSFRDVYGLVNGLLLLLSDDIRGK